MTLKSFFGLEPKEEEPHVSDSNQIMGYLEEQLSHDAAESELSLESAPDKPFKVRITGVFENKGTMILMFSRKLNKKPPPKTAFILYLVVSGKRLVTGPVHFLKLVRDSHYVFSLPKKVYMAERRKHPRIKLLRANQANVVILPDLTKGFGCSGKMVSISNRGFSVKVEKAMDIKSQKPVPTRADMFQRDQDLMIIRIKGLGPYPTVEISGQIAYYHYDVGGYLMGVKITNMGQVQLANWEGFLKKRGINNFDNDFPVVARVRADEPRPTGEKGAPAEDHRLDKSIWVISHPGKAKLRLSKILRDKCKQVSEMEVQGEIDNKKDQPVDLIFLYHDAAHSGLEIADHLHANEKLKDVPVVVFSNHVDIRAKIQLKSHQLSTFVELDQANFSSRVNEIIDALPS